MSEALGGMPAGGAGDSVRSSLDRVCRALEAVGSTTKSGGRFKTNCPLHEDKVPSLSVTWTAGKVLLHCFSCDGLAGEICQALGLAEKDLFDEPLARKLDGKWKGNSPQQRANGARRGKQGPLPRLLVRAEQVQEPEHSYELVATYPYVDAQGRLVQEVLRQSCTRCPEPHKTFKQVFVGARGSRVATTPAGFTPVLYRLPQVAEAIAGGVPVWLFEGEKDADTGVTQHLVATTNAGGAGGFSAVHAEYLRGADVHAVLDRDAGGYTRGVTLDRLLGPLAASVRFYLPAPTFAKADFTDHVEAGGDVASLQQVHVEELAAWTALERARRKHLGHGGVEQALAETQAQLVAAADARANTSGRYKTKATAEAAAADHERYAKRWAGEADIRHEKLCDLVADVHRHVVRTGTEWAAQASEAAGETLRLATTAARAAHTAVGLPHPPSLQPAPDPAAEPASGAGEAVEQADGSSAAGSGGNSDPTRRVERQWEPRPGEDDVPAGITISQPTFRIVNGQIVKLTWKDPTASRRKDPDEGEEPKKDLTLSLVLSLDVRLAEMEYLEDPAVDDVDTPDLQGRGSRAGQEGQNPPAPPTLAAYVVGYTHPATGEYMRLRVPVEGWKDGSFLESLPGPPRYDSKPSGLAQVRDAIKAVSAGITVITRFRSTGWRRDEDGEWFFVHAGGAISAAGVRPVPVLLSGPLARYDLPDPITDPGLLRAAFVEHSAGMLTAFPPQVAAPLLGHVFRSAMGPNPWVMALVGSPGSYKTSLASLAMHHWGELWDRRKPASSLSGNGDTFNAIRIKLNAAKDALYWGDDIAPTKDFVVAQRLLEELARLVHNGEERSRSTRDGLSVLDGTPPRASGLATSEVMPRPGSAAERMLIVPLRASDISLAQLKAFDDGASRHGRALLLASMLQWMAGDLQAVRRRCFDEADDYARRLLAGGETVRQSEAFGQVWAGWIAVTDFLLDAAAITAGERDLVLARVDAALQAAAQATTDPDIPRTQGGRVRELLAYALSSGLAYVTDVRTGEAPPWPLAGRLGWRRVAVGVNELGDPKWRPEARGIPLGYVRHDPSPKEGCPQLLVKDAVGIEQVLVATAKVMADGLQMDRGTALRALAQDHIVFVDKEGKDKPPRYKVKRDLDCEDRTQIRVVAFRLAELLGDDPDGPLPFDDDDGDDPGGGPGPDGPDTPRGDLFAPLGVDGPQQPGLPSVAPQQGLTSPPQEEHPVSTHPDAEGTIAPAIPIADAVPCLICGVRCALMFLGLPLHAPCWWGSTAASRTAAAASPAEVAAGGAKPAPAGTVPPVITSPTPSVAAATPPQTTSSPPGAPLARTAKLAVPSPYAAPAAVLHTDGVWMPDGRRHDLPDPLTHVGHIAALTERLRLGTQVTKWRAEPGQIWVTRDMLAALGVHIGELPTDPIRRSNAIRDLTRSSPLVSAAVDEGWNIGGGGDGLTAWTRVWRGQARAPWVALIPAMSPSPHDLPVLVDDPAPATLAKRLALFAGALGAPWALSPSTTGFDLMKALPARLKDRKRLFGPRELVPPAKIADLELDLNWSRIPSADEVRLAFAHAYDRGGSYPAVLGGLDLGVGEPIHHPEGCPFDRKIPGYFKAEIPDRADWRMPHPLWPTWPLPAGPRWMAAPRMQMAYQLGYEVPILEAYVWPEHSRALGPWGERLRDARTALDVADADAQLSREQIKVVYTRTIGMMGSTTHQEGREGYAPDWRHHIVAKANANVLRRIVKIGEETGRWPIAVETDTVIYASDDPDPISAWPGKPEDLGRGLGQYKVYGSAPLAEVLPTLDGKGFGGMDLLRHRPDPDVDETGSA